MSRCKVCRAEYERKRLTQKVCGDIDCAVEFSRREARRKLEKAGRKALREGRERLKSKADYMREAQVVFNQYVRIRDAGLPCISCGKPDNGKHQRHASHFKSVGSNSALRYHLWNVHASCSKCNAWLSGNIGEYLPRLIEKIGSEKVEWLNAQKQPARYDAAYLKRLKKVFAKRARLMKNRYNSGIGC